MIITDEDNQGIVEFKKLLRNQFKIKALGLLSYFSCLKVSSNAIGYYLSWAMYALIFYLVLHGLIVKLFVLLLTLMSCLLPLIENFSRTYYFIASW